MAEHQPILHIRRDDLSPDVRSYADNLREQIRDIWRTLGVKDVQGFERLVQEKKVREDVVVQVQKLLVELASVVRSGEAPDRGESAVFKEIVSREEHVIKDFFGKPFDVPPLPSAATLEKIEFWRKNGFELHYLPPVVFHEGDKWPGWKYPVNPASKYGPSFFSDLGTRLPSDASTLLGRWVLVDGQDVQRDQYRKNLLTQPDLVAKTLKELRHARLINRNDDRNPPDSRINVHWLELHDPAVRDRLARALGVKWDQVRLPRAIEWNYLGNAFHREWGDGNGLYTWLDEALDGGNELSLVGFNPEYAHETTGFYIDGSGTTIRNDAMTFRLLVVFDEE